MSAPSATFLPVPPEPEHPALERRILERWAETRAFERLREQNAGGPRFSFFDGPITANNGMGVHHAWGRSLKDLFQRYHAALGEDLRYQNGFDCQGLWVEVEVEKALGLNSKREIEEYGLDRFARACRDRVATYGQLISRQSARLGMWMDWERSYWTMTDANIAYIWGFLKECQAREWLYRGHRPMVWCPRCGTSLSQHEVTATDSYRDVTHPSLYVRFRLTDVDASHEPEYLLAWTTTPWTLPANVAAAVNPEAAYARVQTDAGVYFVARERVRAAFGDGAEVVGELPGSALLGRPYTTGLDWLEAQADVAHRVIGWTDVSLEEGTGIVHIAPGCGAEDFQLGVEHGLPTLTPVDESGAFVRGYGWLHAKHTHEAAELIIDQLGRDGWLFRADQLEHRYPVCWRCGTELIYRVVDEWFISCQQLREPMTEAARTVEWTPAHYGKRMEDWLRNMGDWCISRKRYWGLPLPFYFCAEGHMTVIGSREELAERALTGLDTLEELHRPWIDGVVVRCATCEAPAERVTEVGDCWLDAGIVPFSTLGWRNPESVPEGFAAGAGVGLTRADLPDHETWERWFPADWVSEMREQIRLWFYSMLFMSVTLTGRAPYRRVLGYEKLNDETGRAMHKSWGNAIWFDDAVEHMGADVMRWLFAKQQPAQNMNFGYGPAKQVKRDLLPLWNTYRFFVQYASADGWRASWDDVERGPDASHPLDRWIVARVQELGRDARAALDVYDSPAFAAHCETFWEDLSNWYVRRSRRRFWEGQAEAFATLHYALVQAARIFAPAMPFLAEELWQNLVVQGCDGDAPDSVHLAGFPQPDDGLLDAGLLSDMADARAVVALGHEARAASRLRVRQPLASAVASSADPARLPGVARLADEIAAELNVKQVNVTPDAGELVERRVVPNFRLLGPRLGAAVQSIRKALAEGAYAPDADGRVTVEGHVLEPGEYELRTQPREGFEAVEDGTFVVAVDTNLTAQLEIEGRARELVRFLQSLRKELGLEITDRIRLRVAGNEAGRELWAAHGEWIAGEVLASEVVDADGGEHVFAADDAELRLGIERADAA